MAIEAVGDDQLEAREGANDAGANPRRAATYKALYKQLELEQRKKAVAVAEGRRPRGPLLPSKTGIPPLRLDGRGLSNRRLKEVVEGRTVGELEVSSPISKVASTFCGGSEHDEPMSRFRP